MERGSKIKLRKADWEAQYHRNKNFFKSNFQKVIQKTRSVASIRKVFSSSSGRGAGGSADVNGGQNSEKRKIVENNILVVDQSQNWCQKLT